MPQEQFGQYGARQEPSDSELFELSERNTQLDIRTALPGKILSIDASTRKANIQLQVVGVNVDPDTNRNVEDPPRVLQNVQVVQCYQPSGYLSFPLQVDTFGVVITFDRNIFNWLDTGEPSIPQTFKLHDQSSSCFIPGFLPNSDAQANPIAQNAAILEANAIKIGAGALLGGARLNDAVDQAPGFQAWFTQAQAILTAAAALLNLPAPVVPNDFGFISEASEKVSIE